MKNMPEKTLYEIATPIADRVGASLTDICHGGKTQRQEIVWARAQICIAGRNAGWGFSAIGRFLNVGHDVVSRHAKGEREKSTPGQSTS